MQADEADCGCEDAVHELYGYLDGELTEERRAAIAHHLDGCSPCLGAYDFEAELRQVISQRCRDEVPPALRDRIAQALAEVDPPGPGNHDPHRTPSA